MRALGRRTPKQPGAEPWPPLQTCATEPPPAGGFGKILGVAGTDATRKFAAQHGLESMQVWVGDDAGGGGRLGVRATERRQHSMWRLSHAPTPARCLQADMLAEYLIGDLAA